jgi:hypothetical protein
MPCFPRRRQRRATTTSRSRLLPAATGVLVLGLLASGCSSEEEPPSSSPSPSAEPSSTTPQKPPLRTTTAVGEVVGKLPRAEQRVAAQQVGRIVDRWWRAAYLGDDFPRRRLGDESFPAFTKGITAQARADRTLMTNVGLGQRVAEVTATRRRVTVDLLATGGRARTATARIGLDFRVSGGAGDRGPDRVAIRGRLVLTKVEGHWRVFGYDVTRGMPAGAEQGDKQGDKRGGKDTKDAGKQADTKDRQRGDRSGKGNR